MSVQILQGGVLAPSVDAVGAVSLRIVPSTLEEANAFVAEHHRHHKPVPGCKFAVAVADDKVRGVALVGRPVARFLDDGWTLEVNRCCTDGARNAASMLYRAAWRAARELGYRRLITYTLPQEGGASLRGAGMRLVGERGAALGAARFVRAWTLPPRNENCCGSAPHEARPAS